MVKNILLFLAGVLVGANAVFFLLAGKDRAAVTQPTGVASPTRAPVTGPPPAPTASTSTSSGHDAEPASTRSPPVASNPPALPPTPAPRSLRGATPAGKLLIPVAGITVGQLSDTFDDMRGSDRRHEALDIMAPRGTPVLAVADGKVEKLFDSKQGGLTLYQFDRTGTFAYYYAHLDRYAPAVIEGRQLKRGELIGYVGSTGNADPAGPHLHFAVFQLGPEKRWWQGTPINPNPLMGGQ